MSNAKFVSIPAEQYHAEREHVSKSWLDRINQSPAHLRYWLDNDKPDTKALRIGRMLHYAVLEPDIFANDFAFAPVVDRRTTAGKAAWAEFEAASAGKIIAEASEATMVRAMRESIMANKAARALLELAGVAEQSAFWINQETGEGCKCRPDWLNDFCIDIKSTEDASPAEFARSVAKYRYHVQSAHYAEGTARDRFVFIAAEKKPPYAVAVYILDDVAMAKGREARMRNLALYAECKAAGNWHAYPEIVQTLNLPSWA